MEHARAMRRPGAKGQMPNRSSIGMAPSSVTCLPTSCLLQEGCWMPEVSGSPRIWSSIESTESASTFMEALMSSNDMNKSRRNFLKTASGTAAGACAFAATAGAAEETKAIEINAMSPTSEQFQAFLARRTVFSGCWRRS